MSKDFGGGIEQVAGCFGRGPNGVDVGLELLAQKRCGLFVRVIERIAHSHDEVVLVGVEKERVGDVFDERVVECGQIYVVEVDEIESVSVLKASVSPDVFPSGTGDDASVGGASLIAE